METCVGMMREIVLGPDLKLIQRVVKVHFSGYLFFVRNIVGIQKISSLQRSITWRLGTDTPTYR